MATGLGLIPLDLFGITGATRFMLTSNNKPGTAKRRPCWNDDTRKTLMALAVLAGPAGFIRRMPEHGYDTQAVAVRWARGRRDLTVGTQVDAEELGGGDLKRQLAEEILRAPRLEPA